MLFTRLISLAALLLSLPSCTAVPGTELHSSAIVNDWAAIKPASDKQQYLSYALVDLTRSILQASFEKPSDSLSGTFGVVSQSAPDIHLGVGDIVQITIFESQSGGLFIPADANSRAGNYVSLPQQTVDRSGRLSVPYAGSIAVSGRSVTQVQRDIQARLKRRAIEPQAIVSIVSQKAAEVSVIGEVGSSSKIAIDAGGDRVLDMISKAGGIKNPGYESLVTLQRRGRTASVPFEQLVRQSRENIYVLPGDTIYVAKKQATFFAYGASSKNGRIDFAAERLSFAEAAAQAEGLQDKRPGPRHVFLYRIESRKTLERYGVDLSLFSTQAMYIPTVYRADFRDPTGFFLAQNFLMRDKDVIYVSKAGAVELSKFLKLLQAVPDSAGAMAFDVSAMAP